MVLSVCGMIILKWISKNRMWYMEWVGVDQVGDIECSNEPLGSIKWAVS
jgi:hypothetical protein